MSRHARRQFRGERLQQARNTATPKVTAEALARELDVTLRTVQRWESGDNQPGGNDLLRLAARFAVAPDWFYDHEAEPTTGAAA